MFKFIALIAASCCTLSASAAYTFSSTILVSNGNSAQVTIYDFNSDSVIDAVTVNGTPVQWGTLVNESHEIVSDITEEAWTSFALGVQDGSIVLPDVTVTSASLSVRFDEPIYQDWKTSPRLVRGVYMNPVSYDVTSPEYRRATDYLLDRYAYEGAPPVLPLEYRSKLWIDPCVLDLLERHYDWEDGTPLTIDDFQRHDWPNQPIRYTLPMDKKIRRKDNTVTDDEIPYNIRPGGNGSVLDFWLEGECPEGIVDPENFEKTWGLVRPYAFEIAPHLEPSILPAVIVEAPTEDDEIIEDILEMIDPCSIDRGPLLPRILEPDKFTTPFGPSIFDGVGSLRWQFLDCVRFYVEQYQELNPQIRTPRW